MKNFFVVFGNFSYQQFQTLNFFLSLFKQRLYFVGETTAILFFKIFNRKFTFLPIFCRWAGPTGLWDKTTGFNVVLWFVMRTSWSKAHHWTIKHLMMTTGTCKMPPKGHLANNSPSPRLVSTWTDCTMLVLLNFQSAYLLQNTIIVDTRNKSRNDFFSV